MPAHRKSSGSRKRAQPAAAEEAAEAPAEAEAKAPAPAARSKRARGGARDAVSTQAAAAEDGSAASTAGDGPMAAEAEGEEEAPQLPPPGRRATRSGQGKGGGGTDGPSPLGVRVKEEWADGGDGGCLDATVLCALQQAVARADAELGWLSAGKNLLDYGGDDEAKQPGISSPAAALPVPTVVVASTVSAAASACTSPQPARAPAAAAVAARLSPSRTSSKQPAPTSPSRTPTSASGAAAASSSAAALPLTADGGGASSSVLLAPLPAPARERQPRAPLPRTSVAATAAGEAVAAPAAAPEAALVVTQPQPATWTVKQWRKLPEPQRNKTHWDYLLEEMEWLSKDFKEERAWKVALARKAAKAVSRWHQDRAQLESRENRTEESRLRRLASTVSREVLGVWSQVARVAQYKHEQQLEAKRLEARNKQLEFLVGQTARYTSMITEGLTGGADDDDESDGEEGDEASRKRARVQRADRQAELEALQKEAEAPIDEEMLRAVEQESEDEGGEEGEEEDGEEEDGEEEAEAASEAAPAVVDGGAPAEAELAGAAAAEPAAEADVEMAEASAAPVGEEAGPVSESAGAAAGPSSAAGPPAAAEEDNDPAEDVDVDAEEAARTLEGKSGRERMESTLASAAELKPKGDTLATANVRVQVPFLIRGTLREYQHVALDWMVSMYEKNLNGILADEMGLGKTLMTISMLAWLACERGIWGPHLIVVPTSVMLNWEMEIKKFCPAFKILTYYGTQKERRLKRQGWSKTNAFHVCITSYKLVIQDQAAFRRKKWKYLVLDEAHHIKNFRSQRWQTLLNFNAKRRLLLTGTPLQNNLMELWSLLHFLMPHIFESHKEFKDWFSNPVTGMIEGTESVDQQVIDRLHAILRPFLLRRLKKDVEKSLKDKIEHVVPCPLSKRQRELYEDFMASSATRATLGGGSMLGIMNVLMQLRKVCNHPDLFEERPIRSPHMMAPLLLTAAADTTRALHRGPLDAPVDLDMLNLNLASYCELDSYDAFRTHALRARHAHITEVSTRRLSSEPTLAAAGMSSSSLAGGGGSSSADAYLAPPAVPVLSPLRPFVQSAHERRLAWRRSVRATLASVNERRCARTPLWGHGLRRSAAVPLVVGELCRLATAEVAPLDVPSVLCGSGELVLSYERRFTSCRADLEAFTTQIGRARAPPPRLSTRHDPSDAAQALVRQRALAAAPRHRLALLQPVVVRQALSFPDKRLIQWDCGKLQVLARLLRQLHAGGHRCLIFTQMTKMLNVLEAWICMMGFTYLRLDGTTKTEDRQRLMDRFNLSPKIFIFILATRAGGLGINLTGADTVIFYDSDWNPTIDAQAQDRAHRIGQTRQVHIYRLISEATVEENILRKANQKRLLDSVVIQAGAFTTDFLKGGADGLRELFSSDDAAPTAAEAAPAAPLEPSSRGRGVGRRGRGGRGGRRDKNAPAAAQPAADEARPAASPEPSAAEPSAAELEAAMLCGQDAEDVAALQHEREAEAAEAAEFDETIPFREEAEGAESEARTGADTAMSALSGNESDMPPPAARRPRRPLAAGASSADEACSAAAASSAVAITDAEDAADFAEAAAGLPGGAMLEQLESALTPVQLYMLRVLEEAHEAQAAEAERELQWQEWEMDRLARQREEEERLADEEDEVLFYAVPEPRPAAQLKKRGRGGRGSADGPAAAAPSYQSNVAQYLQQQLARSGLERSEELVSLEMRLWGPPAPPDRDTDEPYAPAAGVSSDGEPGGAAAEEEDDPMAILPAGTFHTLEFSSLVTEGVQGLQRVRQQVSERRARAREAGGGAGRRDGARRGLPALEEGGPGRASSRARKAPHKMGADEDDEYGLDDSLSLLEPAGLPPFEPPPGPREGKRSHKKRRPGEPAVLAGGAGAKAGRAGAKAAGAAATKEMQPASPEAPWSAEEDAALLRAVHAHGSANWELVSETVSSLVPQRYRSSRSCHDRCAYVLLPRDDGRVREPGTTLSDPAAAGEPAPAAKGSLAALPVPALLDRESMPLRAGAAPGVGSSMRELEGARANALQPAALQAETTQQVKLFALLTKLVHTAHMVEAQHMARTAAHAGPAHPSQPRLAAQALEEAAASAKAYGRPSAPARPPSPRSLAPHAAAAAAGSSQAAQPAGVQGLRLASGEDPFMKPLAPAQPRQQPAASRASGPGKSGAAASGAAGAGGGKAKAPAQRRPSAKAAAAGAAPAAPAAKSKGSRSKKPAVVKDAAAMPGAAVTSGATSTSSTPAASSAKAAVGGSVGVTAAAAAALPGAQAALNRTAAPQRSLPIHTLQQQPYGQIPPPVSAPGVPQQIPPAVGAAAAGVPPAARAPGTVPPVPQQRVLAPPSSAPPRVGGDACSSAVAPGTAPVPVCCSGQPCGVPLPSTSALPSSSGLAGPPMGGAAAAASLSGGAPRPASNGLPMNVLLEVIQQYPALKSHIHEIVSRSDYSEAEKMAHIKRIIREAKPQGPPPSQ